MATRHISLRYPKCFRFPLRAVSFLMNYGWEFEPIVINILNYPIKHFYSNILLGRGSIVLGTFDGALSPSVLYIEHKLASKAAMSLLSKYYYLKIKAISFQILYHYTWNLKTYLNIVLSLDLIFISNKNDNHEQTYAHDVTIYEYDFQCRGVQFYHNLEFGRYFQSFNSFYFGRPRTPP